MVKTQTGLPQAVRRAILADDACALAKALGPGGREFSASPQGFEAFLLALESAASDCAKALMPAFRAALQREGASRRALGALSKAYGPRPGFGRWALGRLASAGLDPFEEGAGAKCGAAVAAMRGCGAMAAGMAEIWGPACGEMARALACSEEGLLLWIKACGGRFSAKGARALHACALGNGSLKCARILLAAGAGVLEKDGAGRYAHELAPGWEAEGLVKSLADKALAESCCSVPQASGAPKRI